MVTGALGLQQACVGGWTESPNKNVGETLSTQKVYSREVWDAFWYYNLRKSLCPTRRTKNTEVCPESQDKLEFLWSKRACLSGTPLLNLKTPFFFVRSRPGKPNQRKGQNEKFMNFTHFCEFWCFFLRKTSTIHIELLFRNAPAKSS